MTQDVKRVEQEHKDLRSKISALRDFMYNPGSAWESLSPMQRSLLMVQLPIMETYERILLVRLSNW